MNKQRFKTVIQAILRNSQVDYKVVGEQVLFFLKKPNYYTISGYVTDQESGEKLISATVYCSTNHKGTVTNSYGYYSLTLPEGNAQLQTSYLGYELGLQQVNLQSNIELNTHLVTNSTLSEIIVIPEKIGQFPVKDVYNATTISKEFLESTPSIGGEEDYLQAAFLLPGIQLANDGLGGIQVRGGESGQNLLLMDGVPVYIPYHLLGVYSIYNGSTVKSAKLLKGSFPARYGGRLSSIIDIWTKDGHQQQWHAEAAVNLTNAKLLIEGPILKNKSSILVAGRLAPRGFLFESNFKQSYFQSIQDRVSSSFGDLNVKWNYSFSNKDKVYFSFFRGADSFSTDEEEEEGEEEIDLEFEWGNTIGSIKWNHLFNANLFLNTTATFSKYGYEYSSLNLFGATTANDGNLYFLNSRSDNRDLGLKLDFSYLPSPKHTIQFGLSFSNREFKPQLVYYDDEDDVVKELEVVDVESLRSLSESDIFKANELSLYIEDRFVFNDKWYLNGGLRLSSFLQEEQSFWNLEPRFQLHFNPNNKIGLYTTASRMIQYLHLINNVALRLPNDLWFPSSKDLLPQEAWQMELGVDYKPISKLEFFRSSLL